MSAVSGHLSGSASTASVIHRGAERVGEIEEITVRRSLSDTCDLTLVARVFCQLDAAFALRGELHAEQQGAVGDPQPHQ
jgi:hypothetical protein